MHKITRHIRELKHQSLASWVLGTSPEAAWEKIGSRIFYSYLANCGLQEKGNTNGIVYLITYLILTTMV